MSHKKYTGLYLGLFAIIQNGPSGLYDKQFATILKNTIKNVSVNNCEVAQ